MIRIHPPFLGDSAAAGLLVLRIVAGTAMMLHGLPKIQNPMAWMGPEASVPGVLQLAAAVAEFVGGICWIVGAFTPISSLLLIATMAVAISTVHLKAGDPFVNPKGRSYELAADYLAVGVLLLLAGPGKLSVDAWLYGKRDNR